MDCYGEYGKHRKCQTCQQQNLCKKTSHKGSKDTSVRYKGKYKGRGKTRKRDAF